MKTTRLLVTLIALLGVWQCMFAENQAYAVLDDNGLLTFYYNENKPATGAYDIPWDTNNPGWYDDSENILSVAFDASFSSYRLESAANMFKWCSNLTSINFANFNTESVTNMSGMFSYCYALSSLDLSTFNTSNVTNMAGMFQNSSGLETLTLPQNINTEKVTNMGSMFWGCKKLSRLDLSSFDTENVTNMSYMFCECWKLGAPEEPEEPENTEEPENPWSLDLSSFNTSNVVRMDYMFKECKALQSITFSNNFNTSNVNRMEYMFIDCFALQSLDLSSFNTSKIKNMDHMFSGCTSLTAIVLSSFDTSNVTNMQYMFNNCSSLGSLNLSSFDTSNVTTMQYMFKGCSSLSSLDLSNFETSQVKNMSYMFRDCSGLTDLDLSNFDTSSLSSMAFMFYNCTELTSVNIKNFKQTNIIDARSMFYNCKKLEEILCTKFWQISGTYSQQLFYECKSIIGGRGTIYGYGNKQDYEYSRPDGGPNNPGYFTDAKPYAILSDGVLTFYYDLDMKNRTGTYFAFPTDNVAPKWTSSEYASAITTVTFDASFSKHTEVYSTKSLFSGLSNLTDVNDLFNLNTSKVTDMSEMFDGCSSLTSLDLLTLNTQNVTDMSEMFKGCSSLTSLNVTLFDVANVNNMTEMFYGCSSLTTIYCNNDWSANGNVTSSDNMFTGCPFVVGNNVTIAYAKPSDGGYFSIVKEAYAELTEENGTLTFYYDFDKDTREGTIYNLPWVGDDAGWYNDRYYIYRVKFDESFSKFKLKTAHRMFANLDYLQNIVGFEYFNTEDISDMSEMFYSTDGLRILDLRKLDVSSVTDMSRMFCYCGSINYIYCNDNWAASGKVTSSDEMFKGCNYLKGNNEDDYIYDDSKLTVDYAKPIADGGYFTRLEPYAVIEGKNLTFYYGGGKTYDANNYDFDWTTNNGNWKTAATNITTVTFDESFIDYKELTSTADMFSGLTHITTINGIFNLNLSNVTAMDRMFNGCSALTTIYCNDDWSYLNQKEGFTSTDMFNGCGFSNYDASKVTVAYAKRKDAGGYFTTYSVAYAVHYGNTLSFYFDDQKSNLEGTIYELTWDENPEWMPELNDDYEEGEAWAPARKSAKAEDEIEEITKVVFDQSFADYDGLTNARYMFANLKSLTQITGLEYLNTSNVTDMSYMFYCCTSLTSLDLSTFNTSKVTDMTGMFSFMDPYYNEYPEEYYAPNYEQMENNLASIIFSSGFDTKNVESMDMMFFGCDNLTSLDLSNFNTANVYGMRTMFWGCSGLTNLDLSNFITTNVRNMYGLFYGCSGLTSLNVSSFNTRNVENMSYMFTECSGLTSLDLRNFNVDYVEYMFAGCSNLETIYCNDYWSEWEYGLFFDCNKLVGGNGTTYEDYVNNDYYGYAQPDGEEDEPGFFTYQAINLTLCDNQDNSNTLAVYDDKEIANVILSGRTLYTDGDWNTLCLPFNVGNEVNGLDGTPLAGATVMTLAYEDTGFNTETGALTLNFEEVDCISAGAPYLIKWEDPDKTLPDIVNPTFSNVTICNIPTEYALIETDDVDFIGNFNPFSIGAAGDNTKLYLGTNNGLHYPNGASTFYGFRAYFQLKNDLIAGEGEGATQIKAINLNFGDEENGIQEITTDSNTSNSSNTFFTLDGRRLHSEPATPGIYIHNGRKIMIK